MDFLATYHLQGLVLGLCSFLIIGICHPIVIKGEYHWGQRFKWVFLAAGVLLCIGSLLTSNILFSSLMGVGAFSCFWGIHEILSQEMRVLRGWFPENPARHEYYEARRSALGELEKYPSHKNLKAKIKQRTGVQSES